MAVNNNNSSRESFGSRLGFILVSAGCAVGLGNVWRFPFITGKYGGAAFVLMYLFFLVAFALPILIMEYAVGRGSQKSIAKSFDVLEPEGSKWHVFKWIGLAGNYLLMMFYTTVAGWMLNYVYKFASGTFTNLDAEAVGGVFGGMLANPGEMLFWMLVVVVIGMLSTYLGLQNGVERLTKIMMSALFVVLIALCIRSVTLEGAGDGLSFYLKPDFGKLFANGPMGFVEAATAAMGQAFFTLSLGIGAMAVFGSYIDKNHGLTGEALRVGVLDTIVALMAGLIIFPACFAFGIQPDSGPGLVFITLPNVFEQMLGGRLWGSLFFVFMSFAALSTVVAVFENIMSFTMDQWGTTRTKAVLVNGLLITVLSLPCLFGFNVLSDLVIPGIGDIQSVEDFLISDNILPLGSLVFLLFCVGMNGWGVDKFLAEVDSGDGPKFPRWALGYARYVLPVLILLVVVIQYVPIVQAWMGIA